MELVNKLNQKILVSLPSPARATFKKVKIKLKKQHCDLQTPKTSAGLEPTIIRSAGCFDACTIPMYMMLRTA
jgi:hypothetical protein